MCYFLNKFLLFSCEAPRNATAPTDIFFLIDIKLFVAFLGMLREIRAKRSPTAKKKKKIINFLFSSCFTYVVDFAQLVSLQ